MRRCKPRAFGDEEMKLSPRIETAWRFAVVGVAILAWIVLSDLLLIARGDPETLLHSTFGRFSRADTFGHLNGILAVFWPAHSFLVVVALAAARSRRSDVLTVLLVGPVIALAVDLLGQSWSDPNWFVIVAVGTIGWLVGTVVTTVFWALKQGGNAAFQNSADVKPPPADKPSG